MFSFTRPEEKHQFLFLLGLSPTKDNQSCTELCDSYVLKCAPMTQLITSEQIFNTTGINCSGFNTVGIDVRPYFISYNSTSHNCDMQERQWKECNTRTPHDIVRICNCQPKG